MADIIPGRAIINVGIQNQASGSDDLYTAFTKVETNFENLFGNASPYLNFNSGAGISVATPTANTVTFTNTGVTKLTSGTGITLDNSSGNVTISVSGSLSNVVAGVTNVGIRSDTLRISGSPVISTGLISIEVPAIPSSSTFSPGTYISPTLTVDQYGRIVEINSTTSSGTVTSVAMIAGDGISITGSPITESGTISIRNTGVTQLTAGRGISLSGSNGSITISGVTPSSGTVTRIDVTSSKLIVTGSPITSSGTINIEIPNNLSLTGNLIAGSITSNTTANITGNINAGNLVTTGNVTVTGNISLGALVRLTPQTDAPTSPLRGMIYYDSAFNKLRVYNGSAWGNISVT
jgi:hypothetical protein